MTSTALEEDEGGGQEEYRGGLLYGIGPWHIHYLCSSPMLFKNAGLGMGVQEAGDLTLDQIMCLLADRKLLLSKSGGTGGVRTDPLAAASSLKADEKGLHQGRAADGTPIKAKISGKSVARRLMEEAAAKQKAGG